jgi:hypothetical protein
VSLTGELWLIVGALQGFGYGPFGQGPERSGRVSIEQGLGRCTFGVTCKSQSSW